MSSMYQKYCDSALSAQEKEVAGQIAKARSGAKWFSLKNVRDEVDIEQYSHLSAIITRLVKKGILVRLARGKYRFEDRRLMRYLVTKG